MRSPVLPPAQDSVRLAREFVKDELDRAGVRSDAAVLLVGELAENAMQHAQTSFSIEVHVDVAAGRVRVDVVDGRAADSNLSVGVAFPDPSGAVPHGLATLRKLAAVRGWSTRGDGKSVWFEVAGHVDPLHLTLAH
jgi:hypothetical protein